MKHFAPTSLSLAVWLIALAGGCSGAGSGSGPRDVLQRYVEAVESDQPAVAYKLLHRNVRRTVSRAEFIRRWKEMRPELREQVRQLKKQRKLAVKANAVLRYSSGIRMKLVYDKRRRWSLENGYPIAASTPTPEHAIRAFLAAVEQRNLRAVSKLLSAKRRQNVDERLDLWVSSLREALELADEIEVTGTTARLKFGSRYVIELVRQDGHWKVANVEY